MLSVPRSDPRAVPARNLQGTFIDTATDAASELRVIVTGFSDQDAFGPVVWNPLAVYDEVLEEVRLALPQAGDRAWISEFRGDLRSCWVVVLWQPA